MNRLASIVKHFTVLNLVLAGILAVVGIFVLEPLLDLGGQVPSVVPRETPAVQPEQKMTLLQDYLVLADRNLYYQDAWSRYMLRSIMETAAAKEAARAEEPVPAAGQTTAPPIQDYQIIAEQNLFHPERRVPPLTADVPRPEFVLYGTLVSDTVSIAYMSDKKAVRSTPGRGTRQNSLKVGETLSGYQLKEVHQDYVVMARGDDTMQVKVIAPGVKKDRDGQSAGAASAAPPTGARAPVPGAAPGMQMPAASTPQPSSASPPPRTIIQRTSPGRQSLAPVRRAPGAQ